MSTLSDNRWSDGVAPADPLDQLVYLSNLIGQDLALVQPGGGNTSFKTEETDFLGRAASALVVKGSGTDLRTITRAGFTHLDRARLLDLADHEDLSDEAMSAACRQAMLFPERDPTPSVETLLHALLRARFVAHTHDVATMALTDTPHPERHLRAAWGDAVVAVEYVRPGFPLARAVAGLRLPGRTRGLALIKHGLVVWGETARECYESLRDLIARAEAYLRPRPLRGAAAPVDVHALLPAIRGTLCRRQPVVLHLDASPETVARISDPRFPELAARGMATPEHILRAGRLPAIVRSAADAAGLPTGPVPDALKIIAVPGAGLIGAATSKSGAETAVACYRAVLQTIEYAEGIEQFAFLDDEQAREIELWPLERRKIEGRVRKPFEGRVALVVGAGSGVGRAVVQRFQEAGAHVVAADRELPPVGLVRMAVDPSDEAGVQALIEATVRAFGGLDIVFFELGGTSTRPVSEPLLPAGAEARPGPDTDGITALTHLALGIMTAQGIGGRLIYGAARIAPGAGDAMALRGAAPALEDSVRRMAREAAKHRITANLVRVGGPGASGSTEAASELHGLPYAAADVVLFLASERAAYTTGCTITVGGTGAADEE